MKREKGRRRREKEKWMAVRQLGTSVNMMRAIMGRRRLRPSKMKMDAKGDERGAARAQAGGEQRSRFRSTTHISRAFGKGFGELMSLRNKSSSSTGKKKDGSFPISPLQKGDVWMPMRKVPSSIDRPSYANSGRAPAWDPRPQIHNQEGVNRMREAGRLAREVLDMAGTMAVPGVTTEEIDAAVHDMIIKAGAYPSPLNYEGFPKSVCTSVNECICHGIPDSRKLLDGDIVNVDVTVFLNGHHGDTSRTFCVGKNVAPEARQLVEDTEEALRRSIEICKPQVPIRTIGNTIQKFADQKGYGIIRDFTGHGVGRIFHSGPTVLHGRNMERGVMKAWQVKNSE